MIEDEITQLQAQNKALKQQVAQFSKNESAQFIEGLIKDGKLAPVAREQAMDLLNFAEAYDNGEQIAFSEGETLSDKVKALFGRLPKMDYLFRETATKKNAIDTQADLSVAYAEGTPAEAIETDGRIRQYMRENSVSYNEAFTAVFAVGGIHC